MRLYSIKADHMKCRHERTWWNVEKIDFSEQAEHFNGTVTITRIDTKVHEDAPMADLAILRKVLPLEEADLHIMETGIDLSDK